VALDASGTRAVLTSTGGAWPATDVRVDYGREWPVPPAVNADEALTERLLDGLLYDDQQHRGGINLTPRAGNPLVGTNRVGAGVAGIPVAARGNPKLHRTERHLTAKNVTVRMIVTGGGTVEKTVTAGVA
jgi:hypothetical protein